MDKELKEAINGFTSLPTCSAQILQYLKRHRKWISNIELEDHIHGFTGSSITRIARYMVKDKEIKRDYFKKVPTLRSLVHYHI